MTGRASDPDALRCGDRSVPSKDEFPILVFAVEVSLAPTSGHLHTPNLGGVLRRDLELARRFWPCFQLALTPAHPGGPADNYVTRIDPRRLAPRGDHFLLLIHTGAAKQFSAHCFLFKFTARNKPVTNRLHVGRPLG